MYPPDYPDFMMTPPKETQKGFITNYIIFYTCNQEIISCCNWTDYLIILFQLYNTGHIYDLALALPSATALQNMLISIRAVTLSLS